MFAIVQHQQDVAAGKRTRQRFEQRPPRPLRDARAVGDGVDNLGWLVEGRQFDEPDAIRVIIERRTRELDRHARLAHTAFPDQRQQAGTAAQNAQVVQLTFAPDEAGEWQRQSGPLRQGRLRRRPAPG